MTAFTAPTDARAGIRVCGRVLALGSSLRWGRARGLRKDAHDLSPASISNALMFAGCDPSEGLSGVPASKAHMVRALLRSAFRVNLTT